MVPMVKTTLTFVTAAITMAAPVLLLVLFLGAVCTMSLALGSERREYALNWSSQVLETVQKIYSLRT